MSCHPPHKVPARHPFTFAAVKSVATANPLTARRWSWAALHLSAALACFCSPSYAQSNVATVSTQPEHTAIAPNSVSSVTATTTKKIEPLAQRFDWQSLLPKDANVSLIVGDEHGTPLIDYHSERLKLPASTQKLFTAVAATKVLGPDYQFTTKLFYRGQRHGATLDGDIIVQFDGDPRLTSQQLSKLLGKIRQMGIRKINGDVIIAADDDSPKWAPGWLWDDLGVCFAAPIGNLMLDNNCVKGALTSIKPEPSATADSAVAATDFASRVHLRYPLDIRNDARYSPTTPDALCKLHLAHNDGNKYHLSGCYQIKDPLPLQVAIIDPAAYITEQIKRALRGKVALTGTIKVAPFTADNHSRLLSALPSPPLRTLISEMLIKSDNLIADTLLKHIGRQLYQHNGFEFGAAGVVQTLSDLGVNMTSANIVDGSGLSRYNQLNARQLFRLLSVIANDDDLAWIIDTLPLSAYRGTLKYKRGFVNRQLGGKILAKTGSMTGVDNLAGFVQLKRADKTVRYPFVIMESGLAANQHHPAIFAPPFLKRLIKQLNQQVAVVESH